MGKAAQRLNTTQPNISRAIAELEQAFGVRLLDRHRQGITPTAYGRALLDCGTVVFDDLRQGVKKIELLADPGAGEVRIGSTNYTGETFVTAVIARLSRRHPRMTFQLVMTEDDTDKLYRELSERNVDFVIARKGGRLSDQKIAFETLYTPASVVVAGSRSPWARRRRIELAELMKEAWVLPAPDGILASTYLDIFRASGLDPRITVFATPPGARLNLVGTGRFLSILTSAVSLSNRPGIAILPVKLQYATTAVGIITLKNRTLSPAAELFLREAREISKPLSAKR
jgi:DNA-binding transcriptional LysR family regulator